MIPAPTMPDPNAFGRYTDADLERFRRHAEICKVLTDPKRLMLLDVLRDGERSVGDLAEAIGASLANVSQHLGVLRHAGLVDTRRVATSIRYRLSDPTIIEACEAVDRVVRSRLQLSEVG